jgi:predicted nucleic acid-binding protein
MSELVLIDTSAWVLALRAGGPVVVRKLGYDLRRAGLTIPTVDIMIAALALEYDCLLLHADRHFEQIAKHSPLQTKSLM